MAVAFSASDKVIERSIDADTEPSIQSIDEAFEVERCVNWIKEHGLKNVALQFPDSLMAYSPEVAFAIEAQLGDKVAVLGDTSYGECCVDEIAAEHIGADGVIHFGHACLTPTHRLPVLYIFTVLPINVVEFISTLTSKLCSANERIALVYDVQYHHALKDLDYPENITVCTPHPPLSEKDDATDLLVECGRIWPLDILNKAEKWKILYVGANDNFATLIALTRTHCPLYIYDPKLEVIVESGINVGKALMKRYFLVEKTKDAERIGIVVGTLGASRYIQVIDQLMSTIKASGKKAYTFLVGKPNVPKLANFPEIDVFVLVGCPEASLVDSKEFLRPIITPFELDVALNSAREWTGDFHANYRDILPEGKAFFEFKKANNEAGDVSLISGKARVSEEDAGLETDNALAVQDRRVTSLHNKGGGEFLSQRSWQGLEQKLGESKPSLAVEGRKGVAWKLEGEGEL